MLRELGAALDIVDGWESLTATLSGAWKTEPGSDFEGDDMATHPYNASPAAWAAMTAAVSHLLCLRESLFRRRDPNTVVVRLHTHAQLTLIRGALENAAVAVWLMHPDERTVRVLRRLQQEYDEVRQLDVAAKLAGLPAERSLEDRLGELSELATAAGASASSIKNRPGYEKIVGASGHLVPVGSKMTQLIWKAGSAIAHGEMRALFIYLRTRSLGEPSPGMHLGHVAGNVELLVLGGLTAIQMNKVAFDLYRRRRTAPSGSPSA